MLTGLSTNLSQGAIRRAHACAPPFAVRHGYDAAGNQIARPGGVTVDYAPFDLPRKITQGGVETTFGYDGDQQRIRKTTPDEETLYFGDWYERVTEEATGETAHRYHVRSPERVVAIITRGGPTPGTRYVHADHLGSVDVVTEPDGTVLERRSYDAFGQRRNPEWGAPPPASFQMSIPLGFTGHESDPEFGLVNMKGRVFDPGLGRFLTTDPLIADVTSGQAFNPYSYVGNNPLTYVDPSGFQGSRRKGPSCRPASGPGSVQAARSTSRSTTRPAGSRARNGMEEGCRESAQPAPPATRAPQRGDAGALTQEGYRGAACSPPRAARTRRSRAARSRSSP